jgi:hypothetical protein
MALHLKNSHIEAFLRDPVLAAWYFFDVDMDIHQRSRLRRMWFVPEVQDDSGIYTGKTLVAWIWAQLRCILLPSPKGYDPRIVGVFYQDIASAKSIYKPYYDKFISSSERFRNELSRQQGGAYGYRPAESGFEYIYRNGNRNFCPAIGLKEDAAKLASLRVHDGLVEEAKEMEKKSDALDNQILSRINADCWNPKHPLWTNHRVLLGHAEDPATHPAYKRHKAAKQAIWDGDQDTAIITANFRDWTAKFAHMRKVKEIRMAKRTMTPAKFAQRYGGLWEYGTEDWYDGKVMEKCRSIHVKVLDRRDHPSSIFALGWDTALGASARSDYSAGFIWGARPVLDRVHDTTGIFIHGDRMWRISPAWARKIRKGRDGGHLSGMIHRCHRHFQLGRIVFDPGGGGLILPKELWKPEQLIDGQLQKVTGICQPQDSGLYPEAAALLMKWAKGSVDLAHVFEEEKYLATDDGIVEAIHLETQAMFASNSIMWPLAPDDIPANVRGTLSKEQLRSMQDIEETFKQFINIKVETVVKDGEQVPRRNRTGFLSFTATGKKDLAYASIMGLAGLLSLLKDPDFQESEGQDTDCMVMG